jgi:hypothetical protein
LADHSAKRETGKGVRDGDSHFQVSVTDVVKIDINPFWRYPAQGRFKVRFGVVVDHAIPPHQLRNFCVNTIFATDCVQQSVSSAFIQRRLSRRDCAWCGTIMSIVVWQWILKFNDKNINIEIFLNIEYLDPA